MLESLSKRFLTVADDKKSDPDYAIEAYCSIPSLYLAFDRALQSAMPSSSITLQTEINKMRGPIQAKAKEMGMECVKKSVESEHDGKSFREANRKWGWEWDPILSSRVEVLVSHMEEVFPRFDPVAVSGEVEDLTLLHLQNQGSADTWFALTRARCGGKSLGLCRLTLVNAIARYPFAGKLLNSAGAFSEGTGEGERPSALYAKAAHQGSSVAWGNLGHYHMKQGRMAQGLSALRKAWDLGEFEKDEAIKELLAEWVKK